MKRKVSARRQTRNWSYDVYKDLTQAQLAGIGAVALAWNDAEAMYDLLLCVTLGLHHNSWRDVATRINGIDGKHAIIRRSITDRFGVSLVSNFIGAMIENTIGAVGELKGYRDAIIHSRVIDVRSSIGEAAGRQNKIQEVLLTETALSGVYERMIILRRELQALIGWFDEMDRLRVFDSQGQPVEYLAVQHMYARLAAMAEGMPGIISSAPIESSSAEIAVKVQYAMSQYQHHQVHRKSLPPLPEFPTQPSTPLTLAELLSGVLADQPAPPPTSETGAHS
jgi:hypothetical protein